MAKEKKSSPSERSQLLSFEQALEKLEQTVQDLEEGQLGLSESLVRYEEGVTYLKQCYDCLQQAERKIELLAGMDAEGEAVTAPLEDETLSLEEKAASRSRRRSRKIPGNVPPRQDRNVDLPDDLF